METFELFIMTGAEISALESMPSDSVFRRAPGREI